MQRLTYLIMQSLIAPLGEEQLYNVVQITIFNIVNDILKNRKKIMENVRCDIFVLNPTGWEDEANYISIINLKI